MFVYGLALCRKNYTEQNNKQQGYYILKKMNIDKISTGLKPCCYKIKDTQTEPFRFLTQIKKINSNKF